MATLIRPKLPLNFANILSMLNYLRQNETRSTKQELSIVEDKTPNFDTLPRLILAVGRVLESRM